MNDEIDDDELIEIAFHQARMKKQKTEEMGTIVPTDKLKAMRLFIASFEEFTDYHEFFWLDYDPARKYTEYCRDCTADYTGNNTVQHVKLCRVNALLESWELLKKFDE